MHACVLSVWNAEGIFIRLGMSFMDLKYYIHFVFISVSDVLDFFGIAFNIVQSVLSSVVTL